LPVSLRHNDLESQSTQRASVTRRDIALPLRVGLPRVARTTEGLEVARVQAQRVVTQMRRDVVDDLDRDEVAPP
jgi:hypothetical protein